MEPADGDRDDFRHKRGFPKAESDAVIEKVMLDERRPPESIFDFVRSIARVPRDTIEQYARLAKEGRAQTLPYWFGCIRWDPLLAPQ